MTRSTVRVEAGRRSSLFTGPGRILVPAFKVAQARRQWDSVRRGWWVPATDVDDVLAAIEYRSGSAVDLVLQDPP